VSPWTALLQSFHSALIDELCEQHPEPKPELGMPQRFSGYQTPPDGMGVLSIHQVAFEGVGKGLVVLSLDSRASDALGGVTVEQLWASVLERARREFGLRKIAPVIAPSTDRLDPGSVSVDRTVWIPVRLSRGVCFLAIAA
jgi:hypothetical protein